MAGIALAACVTIALANSGEKMKISELIEALRKVEDEHGDLEVSGGYSDYPEGYTGVSSVRVEDHTDRSLAGKKFAIIEDDGPMVVEIQ
jgi:hypothetical protein